LLGAIGLFYYPSLPKAYKNKKIDLAFVLRVTNYISFFLLFALLVSFILFNVQFFLNPGNTSYILTALNTNVDVFHYVLIYGGSVLLAISLYILASFFVLYFFFNDSIKEENR
jgi:hypothetical protein